MDKQDILERIAFQAVDEVRLSRRSQADRNDKVYQAWKRFAPAGPDAIPAALAQVVATAMWLRA